jgi:RNA polymerase sigma-70 factor (ECF subfamily)
MPGEDALLAEVGRRDERALERFYDAYERRLYAFGLRLLGDPGLAEELVQETFMRIWREAAKFDPSKGNANTFLFTIARRLAIDLHRRPSSRPLPLEQEATTRDHADRVDTKVTVRNAMSALSEAHREVLELLHGQQMTQTEAAAVLGVPLGTVKTRAMYALRALKKGLSDHGR